VDRAFFPRYVLAATEFGYAAIIMAVKRDPAASCACASRPDWAPINDDNVMRWPAIDIGEWEELRQCPECSGVWLAVWPEEGEAPPILCRPRPMAARKLRDIDHPTTLRPYCLARLEDHLGEIKERKAPCRKVECRRHRLAGSTYCLEHLIAEQFGRHLARLSVDVTPAPVPATTK
jgi:hypothetical protein